MDDLIFLILDLAADLLSWAWPLIGKFWFLILGYLAYKFFGKQGKKWVEEQSKRASAPAGTDGTPPVAKRPEPKRVRATSTYEPVAPEAIERVGAMQESAAAGANVSAVHRGRALEHSRSSSLPRKEEKPLADPREGMKWALIFGQPRSKSPYIPPYARRKE
jgi:hypothetical protein